MINDKDIPYVDEKEMIVRKLKVFFSEKIDVHLSLINKEWANGSIKEICDTYIILIENKKGEIPILFEEILEVDKFTPKEVKNG
jgi:hypothetical protein